MPHRSSTMILKTTRKYMKYLYMALGVVMLGLGTFCLTSSQPFIDRFIDYQMQMRPGGEITKMWSSPDVNVSLDFYFFNWTNSEEFYDMNSKPKFDEVGPFSYIEVPTKKIFKWHTENNTMDYGKTHYYFPNATGMKASLDDTLVSINTLLVGAAAKSRHWPLIYRTVIDMALKFYKNGAVWKRPADEFFFKGFNDDIVNLLSVLPVSLRSSLGIFVPWDRIGYAYARNGSTDFLGEHTIHTGIGDMDQLGQLVHWKGKNYTEAFPKECNAIKGSPGEFQRTHLRKHEPIVYFFTDFCRAARLDYFDEVMIDGVLGYRYKISPSVFDNGTLYPESECYCNGECLPYGSFNISNCYFGLPVFVSMPHFMDADPFYADQVEGMKPNKSIHDTIITLEPRTGLMLQLVGRLQLNVHVRPTTHIMSLPTKRKMLFPVIWFDMNMHVSSYAILLLWHINNLPLYVNILGVILILLGSAIVAWRPCRDRWNKRYVQHMEINTMCDDEEDDDSKIEDLDESKEISNKEILFGLSSNFPSLVYITHPRRSLPIVISHLDDDEESWKACLEDEHRQSTETDTTEDCDTSLDMNS